jgi:hypothetical protein
MERDPTCVWQDMVRRGASRRDELIPDARRKWDIDETIAVYMADLTMIDAIFDRAELMRVRSYTRPARDLILDSF